MAHPDTTNNREQDMAGRAVLFAGYAGSAAAAKLASENRDELLRFLHPSVIDAAASYKGGDLKEAAEAVLNSDTCAVCVSLKGGGLTEALWTIKQDLKCGMEIDLKAVPVRQECIEICERFGINPYESDSSGSFLVITFNERRLSVLLSEKGINCRLIGTLSDKNDCILRHDAVRSYLNRPEGRRA